MMQRFCLFFCIMFLFLAFNFPENCNAKTQQYVTIDKIASAPLRNLPNGENTIARIPPGVQVKIESKSTIRQGRLIITWYEVVYKGRRGWISQYVTTGDVLTKKDMGGTSSVREAGSDNVRFGVFNKQAKEKFIKWAIKNFSLTYIEYPDDSDWQIWVRLAPAKYKNKDAIESAARQIARAYKMQTGFKDLVIVTVWHPFKDSYVAKGRF